VTGAARTAPPRLQAAQQQRHRAVHQQGLQPLLHGRAERARAALAQRVVRLNRALYAVQGLEIRAAVCVEAACRRAARLVPGAHARARPGPAEAGAAPRAGCAALPPPPSDSACCRTLMSRSPPAALQKPFRYAACGALPARRSLSYISVVLNRCCGTPEWVSQGAGCKGCRDCGAWQCAPVRSMRQFGGQVLWKLGDRAAGALESHSSTAERPEKYCVRTADAAALPHASVSSTLHQSRTTCALRSVEKSSLWGVACRQGAQARASPFPLRLYSC